MILLLLFIGNIENKDYTTIKFYILFIVNLYIFCRRLLELLRLRPQGEADRKWMDAFREAAQSGPGGPGDGPKKSSWPILMFFGIIMGGPYLIWKLISVFNSSNGGMYQPVINELHFVILITINLINNNTCP